MPKIIKESNTNDPKTMRRFKREMKIQKDKDKKSEYEMPLKPTELNIIEETTYKGFPLQMVSENINFYQVFSPFFKDGCAAIGRRSEKAAYNQAYMLVHNIYNHEDSREMYASEEGIEFLKNTDLHSCHMFEDKCVCEDK